MKLPKRCLKNNKKGGNNLKRSKNPQNEKCTKKDDKEQPKRTRNLTKIIKVTKDGTKKMPKNDLKKGKKNVKKNEKRSQKKQISQKNSQKKGGEKIRRQQTT